MANSRLTPDLFSRAFSAIDDWRVGGGETRVACPVCGAEGLAIVDRSTRPYAEWYALSCNACGLDDTVHRGMPGVRDQAL